MREVEVAGATDERLDVNEMSEAELEVYENRVRRMADRQGLQLQKSRRRDPKALGYGTYRLVDPYNSDAVILGEAWYGFDLDQIDEYLEVGDLDE